MAQGGIPLDFPDAFKLHLTAGIAILNLFARFLFWLVVFVFCSVAAIVIFLPDWVAFNRGSRLSTFAIAGLLREPFGRVMLAVGAIGIVVLLLMIRSRNVREKDKESL